MKRLLVIGGTGFVGYHVIKLAKKKKWKISSVSLNKPKNNTLNITLTFIINFNVHYIKI